MTKPSTPSSFNFNSEAHCKELNERFGRLIKNMEMPNRRMYSMEKNAFTDEGTDRYKFEVDFAYAINEIMRCPPYMQGKMFDKAANVISNLITHLKANREAEAKTAA